MKYKNKISRWVVTACLNVIFLLSAANAADPAERESQLLNDAQGGSISAQKELALAYVDGEITGSEVNMFKAFRWVSRSAESGDAEMQRIFARMYIEGTGTESNEEKFVEWSLKAAESGDPEGQLIASYIYSEGREGFDRSISTAIEWALKAATQGESHTKAHAERQLGSLYDTSTISEPSVRDLDKSKKWNIKGFESYKVLAEDGDLDAQYAIGKIYFNGIEGQMVNFDRIKSFEWLLSAAEGGHGPAQFAVGTAYQNGRLENPQGYGVAKDETKAAEWFEKAAAQGIQ